MFNCPNTFDQDCRAGLYGQMLVPEKYESIFDVSSEGPSSEGRRFFRILKVEA